MGSRAAASGGSAAVNTSSGVSPDAQVSHNRRRPHSSLDGTPPDHAYFTPLPLRMAA
jgi:hypothetical protein